MNIITLTIATGQGVSQYFVEPDKMGAIAEINLETIIMDRIPVSHYVGRDKTGNIKFTAHHSAPIIVDYDYK